MRAAGDLRKLFFRQLMQLPAHGFDFLFEGGQFFFGFYGNYLRLILCIFMHIHVDIVFPSSRTFGMLRYYCIRSRRIF